MFIDKFKSEDYPIVVGIDFGTTFSPKQPGKYSKTPTISLYNTSSPSTPRLEKWGWLAKVGGDNPKSKNNVTYRKFKLRLDENYFQDPPPVQIDAIQAIADYLEAFHQYISGKILKGFGAGFSPDKFRFCLTVPAMWSDRAKGAMRQASIKANIIQEHDHPDRLLLVTEPEAAALYCQLKSDQFNLRHQDRFMICDAGGGTVDLIVYEIEETSAGKRLSEVTKGHGASCGSTFVDLNFEILVKEKFKSQGVTLPEKVLGKIVEKFIDDIKPIFDGDSDHSMDLPSSNCFLSLQNGEAIGVEDGMFTISKVELKTQIFDPVIDYILTLIQQQLTSAKTCSAIFLVGGFGSSDYLLRRVRKAFGHVIYQINVPPRPDMAVVRGAVHAGLNPRVVTARVSRQWYGMTLFSEFRYGIDPIEKLFYHKNIAYCDDRIKRIVDKWEKVGVDEAKIFSIMFVKKTTNHESFKIYGFKGDGPEPEHGNDPRIVAVAEIVVPDTHLPSDPDGSEVEATFAMYFGLGETKIEVVTKGEVFTTVLTFDAEDIY
ncbi:hypothetical protein BGW38_008033 [Lunasporangiospora selenospora]|uniref:Actin-like ATPase domain-containing protein n=1 Tax=Lunasporangiospora selenospora TaxID=979761 RepID=A0A9P6G0B3_9FUNG|nr:hypothetical protein BGW38_008033 [Lunasporangiospora selenospora]